MNSKFNLDLCKLYNPSLHFTAGDYNNLPSYKYNDGCLNIASSCIEISKLEWHSKEDSWEFRKNEIIRIKGQDLEESYDLYCQYWTQQFRQLHRNEEELNKEFIHIYGLAEELTPDVPLEEITILQQELDQKQLKKLSAGYQSGWVLEEGQWVLAQQRPYPALPFDAQEVMAQLVSYAVGCMMGRYSLDKEGLVLANAGEGLADYLRKVGSGEGEVGGEESSYAEASADGMNLFIPDEDAIIPVLDDEWFEDDIVGQFHAFLKASFGEEDFARNLAFLEDQLGRDVRSYFVKDFYKDHIQRYKKRPIYWLFSSPQGHFRVLVYLHRYTPDTISNILNNYLREFIEKLKSQRSHYEQQEISGTASEQNQATKAIEQLEKMLLDCEAYERDILYPLATDRIALDLDDGVLVNYNKLGSAVLTVPGLNDKKAKKKVREFDWIEVEGIRD